MMEPGLYWVAQKNMGYSSMDKFRFIARIDGKPPFMRMTLVNPMSSDSHQRELYPDHWIIGPRLDPPLISEHT